MYSRVLLFLCLVLAGIFAVTVPRTFAVEKNIVTDQQLTAVRLQCTELVGTLNRLKQNDTLLRHNRGELYRSIADKLMTPLNQRIASNQLDGADLVKTAATYNQAYTKFYDAYQAYDTSLSAALDTDCSKQPATFYDKVADARSKRLILHQTSQRMVELAEQYKKQFDSFKKAQTSTDSGASAS